MTFSGLQEGSKMWVLALIGHNLRTGFYVMHFLTVFPNLNDDLVKY